MRTMTILRGRESLIEIRPRFRPKLQPMPRRARQAIGGLVYHVLNRGNLRAPIFHKDADYEAFERILHQARQRTPVELFAWCLIRQSVKRGRPYGEPGWQARTAAALGLEHTFRDRGRPRKEKK